MTLWGMDVEAARRLAQQFDDGATTLESLCADLDARLQTIPWVGSDVARFRADWELQHRPALAAVATSLREIARPLGHEADQQVDASRADAGVKFRQPDLDSSTKYVFDVLENSAEDLKEKAPLHATDFIVGGVLGGLVAKHVSLLKLESERLANESTQAANRYLRAPGGSSEALYQNARAHAKFMEAEAVARRSTSAARLFAGKLPVIGAGITAAGIGYDVVQGKPVGQAAVSGVGGALAAIGSGAMIGTAIGGPVGTVVGAGAGLLIGVGVEGALDAGYERLPQGVRDGIEEGSRVVGQTLAEAGGAVGDQAGRIWKSIF